MSGCTAHTHTHRDYSEAATTTFFLETHTQFRKRHKRHRHKRHRHKGQSERYTGRSIVQAKLSGGFSQEGRGRGREEKRREERREEKKGEERRGEVKGRQS